MSNYIPSNNAPKKRRILAKRERELDHHLRHESALETLLKHADQVRVAQVALAKALLSAKQASRSQDEGAHDAKRANLFVRLDLWSQMSAEDVIAHYRKLIP